MENEQAELAKTKWDNTVPKDTWRNYSATGRLAVLLAAITFFVLFFGTQLGLPDATLAAYSVLVFALIFRDKNCSLRKPKVRKQLLKFVPIHMVSLLLIYAIETGWQSAELTMPHWLIVRGRKGSLYEWILIACLFVAAWLQARWMRSIVRRSVYSAASKAES